MRLCDKYRQLFVGASGKPRYISIRNVILKDGKMTGRIKEGALVGAKVICPKGTEIWEVAA